MAYTLYPWQEDCLTRWFENGCRGILHAITGAGKTVLALAAAERLEQQSDRPIKVKIVVPTRALMLQWRRAILDYAATVDIGCFSGEIHSSLDRHYAIYVVNSARHLLSAHILSDIRAGYDIFLIADECHHYASPENGRIFGFMEYAAPAHYFSLGLSATPDCHGFDSILVPSLGPVVYHYDFRKALAEKRVAPFSVLQIALSFSAYELDKYTELTDDMTLLMGRLYKNHPYLKKMESHQLFATLHSLAAEEVDDPNLALSYLNLSYQRKALTCLAQSRMDCLCSLLHHLSPTKPVIIFCERIVQADTAYELLEKRYGNKVGRYHSKCGKEVNRRTLRRFQEKELQILITCRALDEGIDVPDASIGIVLSGASAIRQHIQRLGRILRTTPDKPLAALYYLYIWESSEDAAYLPENAADCTLCSMTYYEKEDVFSHPLYETLALQILSELQKATQDISLIQEAKRSLLAGLVRPDWLNTPDYCNQRVLKAREANDIPAENYWLCMQRLAQKQT